MKKFNVVGAILVKDNKILCCKRGPGRALENYWEFPGGKIQEGETPFEALKRELEEELLIEVNVKKEIFDDVSYDYDYGRVHLRTIICELISGTPKLTEHLEYRWLKPTEIGSLDWAPADAPTVEKIINQGL